MKPVDYVPAGSWLTFIRQTVCPKRGQSGNKDGFSTSMAIYQCKCGKIIESCTYNVKNGSKRSCGCIRKYIIKPNKQNITHGLSKHPLYRTLSRIKTRCYNPKYDKYPYYGGKGVRVCDEWLEYPEKFIKWALSNGWEKGLEIDKDIIPHKLGIPALLYSPEMCSIVTKKENMNSKGNSRLVEYKGKTQTVTMWGEEFGVNFKNIGRRLDSGWSIEDALTIKQRWKSKITTSQKEEIIKSKLPPHELANIYGVTVWTIFKIRPSKKCTYPGQRKFRTKTKN